MAVLSTTVRVPQTRTFEVSAVADDRLVADWGRHNAEALVELGMRIPTGRPFRGREVNLELDGVQLALVHGSAHAVFRDAAMVADRPVGAVVAYAALRGEAVLEHAGSRRVVRPGQVLVCDVDRPFSRGFGRGLQELAVKVPREALTALTGLTGVAAPIVLDTTGPGADPHARALVRLVGRAVAAAVPRPADERAVLELVSVIATGGRGDLPLAHRATARAFIDDHLGDPGLSAASVAAGTGISERHLSRVFADAGTSLPRYVLARRLDLAHNLLVHTPSPSTADVAARCGISSAAYFSRAFKRRFGVAAGELRRHRQPS